MNNNFIFNSQQVQDSLCIHNSNFIFNSENCINSKFVKNSKIIYNSINIENSFNVIGSQLIFDSKNIEESSNIRNSSCIIRSDNIAKSFFIQDSTNLQNCMFCSHLENKEYYLFNKQIDENLFNIIYSQYLNYFNNLKLNFLQQYIPNDCIILPNLKLNLFYKFYENLPDIFWDWVKTLPNYDDIILYNMTLKI